VQLRWLGAFYVLLHAIDRCCCSQHSFSARAAGVVRSFPVPEWWLYKSLNLAGTIRPFASLRPVHQHVRYQPFLPLIVRFVGWDAACFTSYVLNWGIKIRDDAAGFMGHALHATHFWNAGSDRQSSRLRQVRFLPFSPLRVTAGEERCF
jgi:hypothetical protein